MPRYLRLGVPERVRWNGEVSTTLDEATVATHLDELAHHGVEALAVCLLFSYLNPQHEQRLGELICTRFLGMYLSLSHESCCRLKNSTASVPP